MTPYHRLRFLGLAAVSLWLAAAFTPLPNLLGRRLGDRPRPGSGDAIVALAGGVFPDGSLTGSSLRRLVHAIVLARADRASTLVLSGSALEIRSRAELAGRLGLPPYIPVLLIEGRDTVEEAARTRQVLGPRGAQRIVLVTDSQHLVRARRLFESAGFQVLPMPIDDLPGSVSAPEDRIALMHLVLRELAARVAYRLIGYL